MANLETRLNRAFFNKLFANAPFYGLYKFADKRRNNMDWSDPLERKKYYQQLASTSIGALFFIAGLAYTINLVCEYFNS